MRQYGPVEAPDSNDVTVSLTRAEALVLFEWLNRNEDREDSFTTDHYDIFDPADRASLWSLSEALQRTLVEPFESNYIDLVEAARAEVRAHQESIEAGTAVRGWRLGPLQARREDEPPSRCRRST